MSERFVYKAKLFLDEEDRGPISREGPSADFTQLGDARAWCERELHSRTAPEGAFWYGSIQRGCYVDHIGDGLPGDLRFEPDPDWVCDDVRLAFGSERIEEKVARAIYGASRGPRPPRLDWDCLPVEPKQGYKAQARAALSSIANSFSYRERQVLASRYAMGPQSQEDIAACFGVSASRIAHIEDAAVRKLLWMVGLLNAGEVGRDTTPSGDAMERQPHEPDSENRLIEVIIGPCSRVDGETAMRAVQQHLETEYPELGAAVGLVYRVAPTATQHAELLAKALDQFFRAPHHPQAIPNLKHRIDPTLQALGYPKEER